MTYIQDVADFPLGRDEGRSFGAFRISGPFLTSFTYPQRSTAYPRAELVAGA